MGIAFRKDELDIRILVLNPNSSQMMTTGVENAISSMALSESIKIHTYTAPSSSPASIDDDLDLEASSAVVANDPDRPEYNEYDAILVACFSVHPLVKDLQQKGHLVTGIFEASIITTLPLLQPDEQWGIVTTGSFWLGHLEDGVKAFLGYQAHDQRSPFNGNNGKFAGAFSTGLTAGELHEASHEEVQGKMREATLQLIKSPREGNRVRCVVLGCAGMAGLEDCVREAVSSHCGGQPEEVYVIDGAKAGILQMEQMVRSKRAFVV